MKVKGILHHHKKKDGTYQIRMRIQDGQKRSFISSPYSISKSYWNDTTGKVKSNHPDSDSINGWIDTKVQEIKGKPHSEGSLYSFWEKEIERYGKTKSINYRNKHKYSLAGMKKWKDDIKISEINKKLILEYIDYLYEKYENGNTISNYIKPLKRIINILLDEGKINVYPFHNVTVKTQQSHSRALTESQFNRIMDVRLSSKLDYIRKIFICHFLLNGCRASDLLTLKFGNYGDRVITYKMRKTNKTISVGVNSNLADLILEVNKLPIREGNKTSSLILRDLSISRKDEYMFPFLKNGVDDIDKETLNKSINKNVAKLNSMYKRLGKVEKVNLTTHMVRHTFASFLVKENMNLMDVMDNLGHSRLDITQRYIASLTDVERIEKTDSILNKYVRRGQIINNRN